MVLLAFESHIPGANKKCRTVEKVSDSDEKKKSGWVVKSAAYKHRRGQIGCRTGSAKNVKCCSGGAITAANVFFLLHSKTGMALGLGCWVWIFRCARRWELE